MGHEFFWQPFIVLFWIVAAALIFYVVSRRCRRRCHHHHGDALETLRERYAKGEISTSEYEERKKALTAE